MKKIISLLAFVLITMYSLYAAILNVPDVYPAIQAGITFASEGDTVLVDIGTYTEHINFNGKGIVVASKYLTTQDTSFISQTTIDGGGSGHVVQFVSGEDTTSILSGFTITNGSIPATEDGGGGIYCTYSDPQLSNLKIQGNFAYYSGAGIYSLNSNIHFEKILIENNHTHSDNGHYGGGVYSQDSNLIFKNTLIQSNSCDDAGGGIYSINSTISFDNTGIRNNSTSGKGGGIYCNNSIIDFDYGIVDNNKGGGHGHGIASLGSNMFLNHVDIINNDHVYWQNPMHGAGIFVGGNNSDTLRLNNCVVSHNSGQDAIYKSVGNPPDPQIIITYTDVYNPSCGDNYVHCGPSTGCIEEDPLFVDLNNGDYHLQMGSPCINVGDPDSPFDPDGTRTDMGAYYFNILNGDFSANTTYGEAPLEVDFSDGSIGNISSWQWDFQNNGTIDSYEQNPSYTYQETGYFTVSLTVTDVNGFTDTEVKGNYIEVTDPTQNHFIPCWSGTPYSPMTILVDSVTLDGDDMVAGDEIGIYDGDLCVGAGVLVGTIPPLLQMVCSADDPVTSEQDGFIAGNEIGFKLWDDSEDTEVNNVGVTFDSGFDDVFTQLGTAVIELNGILTAEQTIILTEGWNIKSFYVELGDMDLQTIMQPLIDSGTLVKVMDENGNILQYIGGSWYNSIGDMATTEGYYVRVNTDTSLTVEGTLVELPFDIPLVSSWNIMGYPCQTPQDAITVLQPLIDSGKLVKVMDENGNIIQYIAGTWYNSIGNFEPGEGYYINVNGSCVLTINCPTYNSKETNSSGMNSSVKYDSIHFEPVFEGNGYKQMAICIDMSSMDQLDAGDEIGIFNGDICVGSGVVPEDKSGIMQLNASSDDPLTGEQDGFLSGEEIKYRIWDKSAEEEHGDVEINYEMGEGVFEELGTVYLAITSFGPGDDITGVCEIESISPNPFSTSVEIDFSLEVSSSVNFSVYNLKGQLIKTLLDKNLSPSNYNVWWNGKDNSDRRVNNGIYFLKLKTENQTEFKKIMYIK